MDIFGTYAHAWTAMDLILGNQEYTRTLMVY